VIKEDFLERLNAEIAPLLARRSLPNAMVSHGYREVGVLSFEPDVANSKRDDIISLAEEIRGIIGVKDAGIPFERDVVHSGETLDIEIDVKRGRWYYGDKDRQQDDDFDRMCDDDAYAERVLKDKRDKRRRYYQEYLLPIPSPAKDATNRAFLILDGENYDLIASGEKTSEFRRYGDFWLKRLCSHPINTVVFQRGYGGPGRPPPEKMEWEVGRIYLYEYAAKIECEAWRTDVPIIPDWIVIDLGASCLW